MPLQFLSIDPVILESSNGQFSELANASKSNLVIPDESTVAFRVICDAANDPSTLPENDVCSIDKLISCGCALYTPENESFVHHLPREMLADAMIDFTRLTSDGFVELVHKYCISLSQSLLYDQSADDMLRDSSAQNRIPRFTLENYEATEVDSDDLLKGFCWPTLCQFKEFVNAALEGDCELLRRDA